MLHFSQNFFDCHVLAKIVLRKDLGIWNWDKSGWGRDFHFSNLHFFFLLGQKNNSLTNPEVSWLHCEYLLLDLSELNWEPWAIAMIMPAKYYWNELFKTSMMVVQTQFDLHELSVSWDSWVWPAITGRYVVVKTPRFSKTCFKSFCIVVVQRRCKTHIMKDCICPVSHDCTMQNPFPLCYNFMFLLSTDVWLSLLLSWSWLY